MTDWPATYPKFTSSKNNTPAFALTVCRGIAKYIAYIVITFTQVKKLLLYVLFALTACTASAQYYLRGEVKNESGKMLPNARIYVHSIRNVYYSGAFGSFGFTVPAKTDTLTITLDGYEKNVLPVRSDLLQQIILKTALSANSKNAPKLLSVTANMDTKASFKPFVSNETYFELVENEFVKCDKFPSTGYSLSINKASYSNVRRFINMGSPVPPDAVRGEEMVNYFGVGYEEPNAGDIFKTKSTVTSCPWNAAHKLLFLNISAKKLQLDSIPPANFVFLIDVSGSMDMPNRLPLLQSAFKVFVANLRPQDKVSIVMYGGSVGVWLQPTSGAEKSKINTAIEELTASGDTPGESAIRTAYAVAKATFIDGGINRVILATDGDFNVGETTEKALDELISAQRQSGVYLTCLGVGMGNFKDSKLQTLAKKGNGNYAYLDNAAEAEKVLVKELTQTLYGVADNATVNIKFNPAHISEYRLLGFDNKKNALGTVNAELEGGEIGSGANMLAIFEIVPVEDASFYSATLPKESLAKATIHYQDIKSQMPHNIHFDVPDEYSSDLAVNKKLGFAAAVTMFSLKLKQSEYGKNISWNQVLQLADQSADKSDFSQAEFVTLVARAVKIYEPSRKKRAR